MPTARQLTTLAAVKDACSDGQTAPTEAARSRRWFHELGFAIVRNNLAFKHPGFPAGTVRRQYQRMLGARLDGRYSLPAPGIIDPCEFDILGRLYEETACANGTRKGAGEFYTPPAIADYMIGLLGLEKDMRLRDRKFIDIACGTGAFLVAGLRKTLELSGAGATADAKTMLRVAGHFYGMDISPVACDICKINLYLTLLDVLGPDAMANARDIRFNVFTVNSIDNDHDKGEGEAARIKRRSGAYRSGFDYVLGNPPYLEDDNPARRLLLFRICLLML
jgi:predicted RNA methylase